MGKLKMKELREHAQQNQHKGPSPATMGACTYAAIVYVHAQRAAEIDDDHTF
jgi:hypothetical protein